MQGKLSRAEMKEVLGGLKEPNGVPSVDGGGNGSAQGCTLYVEATKKTYVGTCGTSYGSCKCETAYGDYVGTSHCLQ